MGGEDLRDTGEIEKLAYSVQEAAAALGVNVNAVYNLSHRRDFPAVRIGNRILIPKENLARWLDAQASGHQQGGADPQEIWGCGAKKRAAR